MQAQKLLEINRVMIFFGQLPKLFRSVGRKMSGEANGVYSSYMSMVNPEFDDLHNLKEEG